MKQLILALLLLLPGAVFAQQQSVNCGQSVACSTSGPSGTGQGDPAWLAFGKLNGNESQLYGYNTHGREFSIYDYGAKCDGVTNDAAAFVAAEAAAATNGGGRVTGYGICAIATPMVFNDSRVVFASRHFGDGDHDVGGNDNGWVLKWTGSSGATMMTIQPITGVSAQALYGNGMQGITFDCNQTAAIALSLGTVKGGDWNGLYFIECTTAGLFTTPTEPLGEAADVQGNRFIGGHCRNVLTTGNCVRLTGDAAGLHNTSFDTFYMWQALYNNGTAIFLGDTDNVGFYDIQMSRAAGGTGIGVDVSGDSQLSSRSDFFYNLSPGQGGITIRGTETWPNAVKNVQLIGYDITNSPPPPVLGTGVSGITIYKENGYLVGGGVVGGGGGAADPQGGVFAGTENDLNTAFGRLPNTTYSQYIYNGSNDGTWYDDGTGKWTISQNSNHYLQINRQAGSGFVQITGAAAIDSVSHTIASLPTCNATTQGMRAVVSNGVASPAFLSAVSTTGSAVDPVFCNGSGWVYD